jgi:putative transposase
MVSRYLADEPLPRPANWIEIVNRPQSETELEALQKCVNRGCPLGDESWAAATASLLGIELSLRSRGRARQRL